MLPDRERRVKNVELWANAKISLNMSFCTWIGDRFATNVSGAFSGPKKHAKYVNLSGFAASISAQKAETFILSDDVGDSTNRSVSSRFISFLKV